MLLTARCFRFCLLLSFVLFLSAQLVPAMAVEQQIVEISVAGNDRVSTDAIMGSIDLKPGTLYSEEAVGAAKKAVQDMGFFSRVIVGLENVDSGIIVVFNVEENPVVTSIVVKGNTVVETDRIMSILRTQVGGVLNTNVLYKQDIPAVERYYRDQGYWAYVTEEVGIDTETGVLTVPVLEVRVEDVVVTGNKKTKTVVILREMQLKPGSLFNEKVLMKDIFRIYDLGIFDAETAEPYRLAPGSDLGKVIITIPVKERMTGEVTVGIGYSNKQKLVGQAKYSETNFGGMARTVSAMWEQSSIGGSSTELSYYEPWLDKKHTSLNVSLYDKLIYRFSSNILGTTSSDTDGENYDERHRGGSITLGRPTGSNSRSYITVRDEDVAPGAEADPESMTVLQNIQLGHVTSGTFRFTASTRDTESAPFVGMYGSTSVEVGSSRGSFPMVDEFGNPVDINGDPLDEETDVQGVETRSGSFTKYSVDLRKYISKGGPRKERTERRNVIALRLQAGAATGVVPFFEQYFVGGAESLRGYREDRFWGRYMLLTSAEYRMPMGSSMDAVFFVDYGDAWGTDPGFLNVLEDFEQHDSFSPSLGFGPGIRVVTPIGPLRLDYGFGTEGSRAHFSIGHAF